MRLLILSIVCSALAGCGYHTATSAAHLPDTTHSIAVPIFENATQSYHTELAFTQAVVRELTSRTKYAIVNSDGPTNADADATIHGRILTFQIVPLIYNLQTGQSSSFLITITASVHVNDRDGRLLYENNQYTFRQQYETTTDLTTFIQEDPAAVTRLSRDFAQSLVSDMLESF
ncbi:LptE family protein [Acidisarcina polymorpha]|nr:LptE family protein [Acidisarcina polymorpha]